jgi:hypothetical protein
MRARTSDNGSVLDLRAGDMVEVRTRTEILATLDASGRKDALPFMPEMLQYCGQRFRVYKRADKTCDTISRPRALRMENAVHLENVRCDGALHGGCQAGCLIFWKESWLKRLENPVTAYSGGDTDHPAATSAGATATSVCTEETLLRVSRRQQTDPLGVQEDRFSCQATELPNATSALPWWDIRQYLRDITSGNVQLSVFARASVNATFNLLIRVARAAVFDVGSRVVRWAASSPAAKLPSDPPGGNSGAGAPGDPPARSRFIERVKFVLERILVEYPHVQGRLRKTPSVVLGLQPGEYVRVKSKEEIASTLDVNNRNRGLLFDVEMVPYCGGTYRVRSRVNRMVNEKTGRMVTLPNPCVILDGVVCQGCVSRNRLFCPRSIYSYWHEIWLERAELPASCSTDTGCR